MREDAIEIVVALTKILAEARQRLDAYEDTGGEDPSMDEQFVRWRTNVTSLAQIRDSLERTVVDL